MATPPKDNYGKIQNVGNAWETLRPKKKFSDMTLADYRKAVFPSEEVRTTIARLEGELTAAISKREIADAAGLKIALAVVSSVKGDLAESEDGELYEAMGYIRKSERKSGLHRKSKTATAVTK